MDNTLGSLQRSPSRSRWATRSAAVVIAALVAMVGFVAPGYAENIGKTYDNKINVSQTNTTWFSVSRCGGSDTAFDVYKVTATFKAGRSSKVEGNIVVAAVGSTCSGSPTAPKKSISFSRSLSAGQVKRVSFSPSMSRVVMRFPSSNIKPSYVSSVRSNVSNRLGKAIICTPMSIISTSTVTPWCSGSSIVSESTDPQVGATDHRRGVNQRLKVYFHVDSNGLGRCNNRAMKIYKVSAVYERPSSSYAVREVTGRAGHVGAQCSNGNWVSKAVSLSHTPRWSGNKSTKTWSTSSWPWIRSYAGLEQTGAHLKAKMYQSGLYIGGACSKVVLHGDVGGCSQN